MNQPITTDNERLGKISASGMERFVNCAGSFQAEQGMPELPAADVTAAGTRIHSALETGDMEGMEETEADIAKRIMAMDKSAVADFCRDQGIESVPLRHAEERLWIRHRATLELLASAQLDIYYVHNDVALIIDGKSGFKKATAADKNWQLLTQAIALRHDSPAVKTFFVAIAASRLGSSFDIAQYSAEDIDAGERELHHAIWKSKQPNPQRNPGTWCQYCRANGHCAEAAAYSSIVLFEMKLKDWNKLGIIEAVQQMTPAQLAHVFVRSKIAGMIFDNVEARLKIMSPEDLAKIGLGLKPGAERRTVTSLVAAREKLSTVLSSSELDECLTLSVTNAQKAIGKKKQLKAEVAKTFTNELLGEVLETKQNKPSLEIIA